MSAAKEMKMKEWKCNIFQSDDRQEMQIFSRKRKSDI